MKIKAITIGLLAILALASHTEKNKKNVKQVSSKNKKQMSTFYDFKVKDINGEDFSFSQLKGKKILIVNTASECGLTPQYKQLEEVYKKYGTNGKFTIIGFPANNFGSQEPGNDEQIKGFCEKNYGVTFPIMSKISVKGEDIHPVYKWLTQKALNGVEDTEVTWNFQKFLIDENGKYIKTISPRILPDDAEIIRWIEGK